MKKSITTLVALCAAALGITDANASHPGVATESASLSCGATQFTPMSSLSSTLASRQCDGSYVYGIGISADEAVQNLNGFLAVREAGVSCHTDVYGVATGSNGVGVFASFVCNGYPIAAVGGTPTIAASNALAVAEEMAVSGTYCRAPINDSYSPETYGFRFAYACGKVAGSSWVINGLGSNIDQANAAAMRLMRFTANNGGSYRFDPATLNGVIFNVILNCNGNIRLGYGSSVTAAANDAMSQAGA